MSSCECYSDELKILKHLEQMTLKGKKKCSSFIYFLHLLLLILLYLYREVYTLKDIDNNITGLLEIYASWLNPT